ncbi:MAG: hypothetical protein M1837_006523 [Sclerophora amabilis]|nr:MAG: hypothetical protein M1837_006523 [Sclerophora amabilis]
MAATSKIVPEPQADSGKFSATSPPLMGKTISPYLLRHLEKIYHELASNGRRLSRPDAASFLHHVQGLEPGHTTPSEFSGDEVTFDSFLDYVCSPSFSALAPPRSYDLSYPLSNYFICSSHNTYLTGNQLYGQSSTDGYKNVLLRGCRCIEIDVWDGESETPPNEENRVPQPEQRQHYRPHMPSAFSGKKGIQANSKGPQDSKDPSTAEGSDKPPPWVSSTTLSQGQPRVLHGYTLTKDVSFRDVCIAIRESAFVTSDLPVIVSLEVHASLKQQEIMVDIMHSVWEGLMVHEPVKTNGHELPNPGQLRHKILVKVKHVHREPAEEEQSPTIERIRTASSSSSEDSDSGVGEKKKKSKVLEALSRLGIYMSSYHFASFSQPGKDLPLTPSLSLYSRRRGEATIPSHVFSLSERALMKQHEENSVELFSHNREFLMRAYPHGLRVSSSNLDPAVFWRKGVQMVALNWQKWDQGMMLNEAMFAGEGGWALKPKGYRGSDYSRSGATKALGQAEAIDHKTMDLTIHIFAGQGIPLPIGDEKPKRFHPYIKCELHVEKPEERSGKPIENDGKSKDGEFKRKTKTQKGVNPDFRAETLSFAEVKGVVEELSFLR